MSLNSQVENLFQDQIQNWELARTNFQSLKSVKTKSFSFGSFDVKVQFNPARIVSSGAKTDAKTIAERKCFLCAGNLPAEQKSIDWGEYSILVNPFPIFPEHFTIPRKEHVAQQIKPFFADMLQLTQALDSYVVFYNGPKCGASAPDHMHFQAGTKEFLPLIGDYRKLKPTHAELLETTADTELYLLKDYLRTVLCIESKTIKSAQQIFEKLYLQWQIQSSEEPMMNIVCSFENGVWYTFILLREDFRPWQYYATDEKQNLLISPATVEMSGVFITPVESHFLKITKEDIVSIFEQSSKDILPRKRSHKEPLIQVGIMSDKMIDFVLNGSFIASNNKIYSGVQKVEYKSGKILFEDELFENIRFRPLADDCSFELCNVLIGIQFHWQRKENQRFKGLLRLIIEGEMLTAINEVLLEDYLTSVISSEMSATASDELLKAHAVISRSWLLANLDVASKKNESTCLQNDGEIVKWYERDAHVNFDVCADDHCQRYQGISRASTPTVQKAISETRGQVLMSDNEICDARFSKSCGGVSETFENAWAEVHHSYLSSIVDTQDGASVFSTDLTVEENAQRWIRQSPEAFCNTSDKKILSQVLNNYDQETTDFYRWQVEYTQQELSELLSLKSGFDFGQILDIIPMQRGASGRIIRLKIVGTKKTMIVGKELEIRKWLSKSHLYSSAFVIDKLEVKNNTPQKIRITGAGWGHGVGLCQIGAAVMGAKGYKYDEILAHYFKGAELKKIY